MPLKWPARSLEKPTDKFSANNKEILLILRSWHLRSNPEKSFYLPSCSLFCFWVHFSLQISCVWEVAVHNNRRRRNSNISFKFYKLLYYHRLKPWKEVRKGFHPPKCSLGRHPIAELHEGIAGEMQKPRRPVPRK